MPTVGEQLKNAREAKELGVRDVAEVIKLKSEHVQALEESNYDVFGAPVFIKGFVKSYASYVGLNLDKTMKALAEELGQTSKFREPPPLTDEPKGVVDFLMLQLSKVKWSIVLPILIIALVLLIGSGMIRAWQNFKSRDPLSGLEPARYEPSEASDPSQFLKIPSTVSTNATLPNPSQ